MCLKLCPSYPDFTRKGLSWSPFSLTKAPTFVSFPSRKAHPKRAKSYEQPGGGEQKKTNRHPRDVTQQRNLNSILFKNAARYKITKIKAVLFQTRLHCTEVKTHCFVFCCCIIIVFIVDWYNCFCIIIVSKLPKITIDMVDSFLNSSLKLFQIFIQNGLRQLSKLV